MKKITLLMLILLSITGWSQGYKFHTLQDLGPNIEIAISAGCAQTVVVGPNRDVNLNQQFKLEVGKVYKSDLILGSTSGSRYYKVLFAVDYYLDKGSDIDEPAPFELIPDLCNSLSWKYTRPVLLGSNLEEAQANFCSNTTANTLREKVNIKTERSLTIGDVYFMDFGKGANYYLITGSSIESGDSEYQLNPTNSGSVFSRATLNCPKPDLQAVAVDFGSGTMTNGVYVLKNIGGRAFTTSHCLIFFSKGDSILSSDDILIKDITIGPLNSNEGKYGSRVITSPVDLSNGSYYAIMQLINSEDINNSNNIISSTTPFVINQTTTPVGKPDLIIDSNNTIVHSDCSTCNSTLSELKDRHKVNNEVGYLRLPFIAIKNTGAIASAPTDIQFYLSQNTTLETAADPKYSRDPIKINPINPGETYIIQGTSLSSREFGNNGTIINNNWNILMVVDDSKTNSESNENNNITAIPVTFYNPNVASFTTIQLETKEPYSINIYDIQGQKVLTKEVNSIEEENKSLDSLKNGIYIIKAKGETRKVLR